MSISIKRTHHYRLLWSVVDDYRAMTERGYILEYAATQPGVKHTDGLIAVKAELEPFNKKRHISPYRYIRRCMYYNLDTPIEPVTLDPAHPLDAKALACIATYALFGNDDDKPDTCIGFGTNIGGFYLRGAPR